MAKAIFSPNQARIPIGTLIIAGRSYEVAVNAEWAKYFDSMTSTVNETTNTVINGRNGVDGAAVSILGGSDGDSGVEFIPGPPGSRGPQGDQGPALFLLQDEAPSNDTYIVPQAPAPEAFIVPTLLNSWVNFGAGFGNAGYYKDAFGIVHLRGTVATGVAGLIFTLPAGYRPAGRSIFCVIANNALGRVDVDTNGDVIQTIGSNVFVSLESITFRAA